MAAWLEALLGKIFNSGVAIPLSKGLNFSGGLKAARNPTTQVIDVTFDGDADGVAGPTGATGPAGEVNLSHAPFVDLAIVSGAVEIDLSAGGVFRLLLDADATDVTVSGATTGEANFFTLHVLQDGTGGRAFTPPASWTFSTGSYVVSSAANAADLLQGISYDNGSSWLVSYLKGYV